MLLAVSSVSGGLNSSSEFNILFPLASIVLEFRSDIERLLLAQYLLEIEKRQRAQG